MQNFPPIPENESARIEKLRYYHILDTEAEVVFDDLTKLAAKILAPTLAKVEQRT